MSISTKTGAITGKLVKGTVRAPKATGNWFKTMGQDMSEGYRSVVPKKVKIKVDDEPIVTENEENTSSELVTAMRDVVKVIMPEIDDQPVAATEEA